MNEDPKLKLFEMVVQTVLDEYQNKQDKFLFRNKGEAKGYQHRGFREAYNLRKKVRQCKYPGCSTKSISKSHTLQRASLELISESQHVLRPEFKEGRIVISSVGINEASTFPGFCQLHEGVFSEFERDKNICTDKGCQLQVFRTICREIVLLESQIEGLIKIKDDYIKYRNSQFELRVKEILGPCLSGNLKNINLKSDNWRITLFNREFEKLEKQLKTLRKQFKRLFSDIKSNKYQRFCICPVELDWIMPVALAGRANFCMKIRQTYKDVSVFINVIPFENKTLAIIAGDSRNEEYIENYSTLFYNPLNALNIIERWMVHGTDHWFIKPSVWNKLPIERQNRIIEAISNPNSNIGQDFAVSIFDDLRSQFIELAMLDIKYIKNNMDFIKIEKQKIL